MFWEILPSILSGIALALIAALAGYVMKKFKTILEEFKELKESQRNQIKDQIVNKYEKSKKRGYITFMELETMNRLSDSYFKLGGNNYIHAIMGKANSNLSVRGEQIPND